MPDGEYGVRLLYGVRDHATGLSYGVWLPVVRYPGTQFAVPVAARLPEPSDG